MSSPAFIDSKQELLFLGKECHHPACHLHDFLPFLCPACHLSFCQPHFLPSQHSCTAPLPPSMVDRIAPKCPLCDEIVSSDGRNPNEAVERHIMSGTCVGLEGGLARRKEELRKRKESGVVCWRNGCVKMIVVPMRCETCGHVFCPTHRHTTSHSCHATPSSSRGSTPQPSSQPLRPTGRAAMSRLLPPSMLAPSSKSITATKPNTTNEPTPPPASPRPIATSPQSVSSSSQPIAVSSSPLDARAAAASAALKRAGQDVKVPFVKSKTEKRADAEMQSTIQALKARHDKGLLSKTEEIRYAELVGKKESARRSGANGPRGKDGCVVC